MSIRAISLDGHRRLTGVGQNFLHGSIWADSTMTVDMAEFVRRMERGIYDEDSVERALRWVKTHLQRRPRLLTRPKSRWAAPKKTSAGNQCPDGADCPRDLMVGNPKLAERLLRKRRRLPTASRRLSGDNASGQTTRPTARLLWRRILCSKLLTGMASASRRIFLATENDYLNGV